MPADPRFSQNAAVSAAAPGRLSRLAALRVVLIYSLFAAIWIAVSDKVMVMLVADPEAIARLSILKGWLFIVVTAVLLYTLLLLEKGRLEREMAARQRSEQALHATNEQLRWLSDNLPNSYVYQYLHGANGDRSRFLYISAGVTAVHQVEVAAVLQDAGLLRRQISPDHVGRMHAAEVACLKAMRDFEHEVQIVRPDGNKRWLRLRSRPHRQANGHVIWDGMALDVTAQQQAAAELFAHKAMLEEMGRTAKVGGWRLDVATGEGYWTDELARIHDLDPADPIDKDKGLSFYTEESRPRIALAVQRAIAHGEPYDLELEIISAKGVRKRVRTIGYPVWSEGKVVSLRGSLQDISARAEAELAVREATALYRSLVDQLPAGVFRKDAAGRYVFVSEEFLRLTRSQASDYLGRSLDEVAARLQHAGPGDVLARGLLAQSAASLSHHARIMATGATIRAEEVWPQADGSNRHFLAVKTPVYDAQRRIAGSQGVLFDITALRQAEAALRDSEEQFRTLVALSPDAIFINQGNRVVYMNQQGLKLWRAQSESELIGLEPLQLIHPDSRDVVRDRIRRALEHRLTQPLQELKILARDGAVIDVETTAAVFEFHGAPAIQVVVRDITERRQLDAEHERQRRRIGLLSAISQRLTLNDSPGTLLGGIFADLARELEVDIFANYMVSPAGDRLLLRGSGGLSQAQEKDFAELAFGISLCGLVAKTGEQIVIADLPASTEPQAAGIIAIGVRAYAGFPMKAGGRLIGTVSFGSRRRGQYAAEDLRLMKTVVDLVTAAVERERLFQALVESDELLRQMSDNLDEVFWVTDVAKGRMHYVSRGYERIWGRPVAELHAAPRTWMDCIVESDRERVRAAAMTKQQSGEYHEEYRITRPDGSLRWIYDRAFPVRDASGAIYRVVGIAQDITERKRLEEQFLRAQRMEAIGTLAGGLAHDLNNILAPVLMVAGLLKGRQGHGEDRDALSMVETSAQRGAAIIRQLMLFSRGMGGERMPVQMRHLVREMTGIMQETFPREITIKGMVPPDLWPVLGDATQLHQVLMNLCVNARDAMPKGGQLSLAVDNVTLTVAECVLSPDAKPGRYVVLTVLDTGQGIPPEVITRIFDPFFTTKEIGKGTGLGLSTVQGIVRNHGGFVVVNSELGRGTRFRVYLPAAEGAASDTRAANGAHSRLGRGELILVVDDEASVTTTTSILLQKHNYRVLVAANGQEASARFLANQPAVRLVLTDLMMPVMGGIALVRALRAIRPDLRIIATTGLDDKESIAELAALGVPDVLVKPCEPGELLDTVRRVLDRPPAG